TPSRAGATSDRRRAASPGVPAPRPIPRPRRSPPPPRPAPACPLPYPHRCAHDRGRRAAQALLPTTARGYIGGVATTSAAPAYDPDSNAIERPSYMTVGTIVFISSELMFFVALFAAMFTLRAESEGPWPPADVHL